MHGFQCSTDKIQLSIHSSFYKHSNPLLQDGGCGEWRKGVLSTKGLRAHLPRPQKRSGCSEIGCRRPLRHKGWLNETRDGVLAGRRARIVALVRWAVGDPAAAWGLIKSSAAPNGPMHELETACKGTEWRWRTPAKSPGQVRPGRPCSVATRTLGLYGQVKTLSFVATLNLKGARWL